MISLTKLYVGLHSDIYILISFKLRIMIKTIKFCILISVWMTLTFIQGYSCINFGIHFLANLNIHVDEIQYVATTCWFVEAHAKFI